MQCAIHPDEYSHVSICSSTKEMWDKLELIYEGTSEVKETKVNILVHEYEMFKMSPVESISNMFARLSKITNGLKALRKNYMDTEIVHKVLRSLPLAWHTITTVIKYVRVLLPRTGSGPIAQAFDLGYHPNSSVDFKNKMAIGVKKDILIRDKQIPRWNFN
ncbi:hypothetical protein Taro_000316 [Colocasia esculenta]|uniref:UBN2_2 domain-containing protein n=1 Tax=Colocasia esculenta TaxID=4460 RepID=A0A843TEI1_COLES|nr:hypothetical protein [Colocasia esculenta]